MSALPTRTWSLDSTAILFPNTVCYDCSYIDSFCVQTFTTGLKDDRRVAAIVIPSGSYRAWKNPSRPLQHSNEAQPYHLRRPWPSKADWLIAEAHT